MIEQLLAVGNPYPHGRGTPEETILSIAGIVLFVIWFVMHMRNAHRASKIQTNNPEIQRSDVAAESNSPTVEVPKSTNHNL